LCPSIRGGPLKIPGGGGGGGGENSPKQIRAKKNAWKKNSRSHYVREKKIVQANSKVQIVLKKILAEVKCIKKKSCRDMKKNRAAKILYSPSRDF
jgi:hypothetical protein